MTQPSVCRFVKDGSTFVQALSLGSIQFCGFVRSARLPPLSCNLDPKPRVEVNMQTNLSEEAPVSLAAGEEHVLCVCVCGKCACVTTCQRKPPCLWQHVWNMFCVFVCVVSVRV